MKSALLLEKKIVFYVVYRPLNASKLSAFHMAAKDRKQLKTQLRARSISEFTAEPVLEVLA